jgi:hypothetical protein
MERNMFPYSLLPIRHSLAEARCDEAAVRGRFGSRDCFSHSVESRIQFCERRADAT